MRGHSHAQMEAKNWWTQPIGLDHLQSQLNKRKETPTAPPLRNISTCGPSSGLFPLIKSPQQTIAVMCSETVREDTPHLFQNEEVDHSEPELHNRARQTLRAKA